MFIQIKYGKTRARLCAILGSFFLFILVPMVQAESAAYRGELLTDNEFNFSAYIPEGWDKEIDKKEQALRIELFSSPMTFIITEIYRNFDQSLLDYKNIIWRRQKIKFHTLEKISDRTFKGDGKESFLLICRFHHRGKNYLQRTYGRQIGQSAYVVNFIAPSTEFYRKLDTFNSYVSHFKLSAEGSPLPKKEDKAKKESYDESKFQESEKKEKSAFDLNFEDMTDTGSKSEEKSAEKGNKGEFTLLPDGSWGFADNGAKKPPEKK
jgi:hypothetical protein